MERDLKNGQGARADTLNRKKMKKKIRTRLVKNNPAPWVFMHDITHTCATLNPVFASEVLNC